LKFIGDYIEENKQKETTTVIAQLANDVEYFDVAAITNMADTNITKQLTILTKQNGQTSLNMTSTLVEPLSYPLLFLNGEEGWGEQDKDIISFWHCMCYRMLMPEKVIIYDGPEDKIGKYTNTE
jgi:hypothetical protein